jgi:hypothetical protein
MADILWLKWQVQHVERRHGVTARQFQEAWDDPDREELAEEDDPEWGPYFRSMGSTSDGRLIEMVWRWQDEGEGGAVWPITGYFAHPTRTDSRQRPRRRRRRA